MLTNVVSGPTATRLWARTRRLWAWLRHLPQPDRRLLLLLGILLGVAAGALAFGPAAPWRLIAWAALALAGCTGTTAVMLMAAQTPGPSPAAGGPESSTPLPATPPPPAPVAAIAGARRELEVEIEERTAELAAANESLRLYQRALAESKGLATLGRLVDASTHETNNRLGTAILAVSSLRDKIANFSALYKSNQITRSEFDRFLESSAEAGEVVQTNLRRAADLVGNFKQLAADQADRRRRPFELKAYLETVAHGFELAHRHNGHQVRIEGCEVSLNHRPGAFSKLFCELVLFSLDWSVADRTNARIRLVVTTTPTAIRLDYADNGRQLPAGVTGASTLQNLAGIDAPLPEIMELITVVREDLGGAIYFGPGANGFGNLIRIELPKAMVTDSGAS